MACQLHRHIAYKGHSAALEFDVSIGAFHGRVLGIRGVVTFEATSVAGLLDHERMKELPLFSDLGEDVFIPRPVKEYPPVHFLKIGESADDAVGRTHLALVSSRLKLH